MQTKRPARSLLLPAVDRYERMTDEELSNAIETLRSTVLKAEADLRIAVGEAHVRGRSWAMIGRLLGVTAQTAHRKYAEGAQERARVAQNNRRSLLGKPRKAS